MGFVNESSELKTSTITIEVYTNIILNIETMFKEMIVNIDTIYKLDSKYKDFFFYRNELKEDFNHDNFTDVPLNNFPIFFNKKYVSDGKFIYNQNDVDDLLKPNINYINSMLNKYFLSKPVDFELVDEIRKSIAKSIERSNIEPINPYNCNPRDLVLLVKKNKKGLYVKNNILSENGTIYSIQLKKEYKGLDLRKVANEKPKKTFGLKKQNHFGNQIMMYISIKNNTKINLMVFKNNFKIAGLNNEEQVEEVLNIFLRIIKPFKDHWWSFKNPSDTEIEIYSECVMRNSVFKKFESPIDINRLELTKILNSSKYEEKNVKAQLDATSQPSIKTQFYISQEKDNYQNFLFSRDNKLKFYRRVNEIPYEYKKPSKKVKTTNTTVIIFSSTQIIISSKSEERMKKAFDFINGTINANPEIIEQRTQEKIIVNFDEIVDFYEKSKSEFEKNIEEKMNE